jgi:hypothetical protein
VHVLKTERVELKKMATEQWRHCKFPSFANCHGARHCRRDFFGTLSKVEICRKIDCRVVCRDTVYFL